jgi:hypothetical protein
MPRTARALPAPPKVIASAPGPAAMTEPLPLADTWLAVAATGGSLRDYITSVTANGPGQEAQVAQWVLGLDLPIDERVEGILALLTGLGKAPAPWLQTSLRTAGLEPTFFLLRAMTSPRLPHKAALALGERIGYNLTEALGPSFEGYRLVMPFPCQAGLQDAFGRDVIVFRHEDGRIHVKLSRAPLTEVRDLECHNALILGCPSLRRLHLRHTGVVTIVNCPELMELRHESPAGILPSISDCPKLAAKMA